MNQDEIRVGKAYTNGHGGVRRVVSSGTNLYVYGRGKCEAVRYEVLASGTREKIGLVHSITKTAFARWAESETGISPCCAAPCHIEGHTTNYYTCTKCGQPCDPKPYAPCQPSQD